MSKLNTTQKDYKPNDTMASFTPASAPLWRGKAMQDISHLQNDIEIMRRIEEESGIIYTKVAFYPDRSHLPKHENNTHDVDREWMWVEVLEGGRNEGIGKIDNHAMFPRYKVSFPYNSSIVNGVVRSAVPVAHKTEIYFRHNNFICRLRDFPWVKECFENEEDKVGCKPVPGTLVKAQRQKILEYLRKEMRAKEVAL